MLNNVDARDIDIYTWKILKGLVCIVHMKKIPSLNEIPGRKCISGTPRDNGENIQGPILQHSVVTKMLWVALIQNS